MKRGWWWLIPCLAACASGPEIRASAGVLKFEIEAARKMNALRCAPKELAEAEANLDFVFGELDEGSSSRAHEHLLLAETATRKAKELSKDCGTPEKVVLRIETTDADADGVLDKDDKCPTAPGPVENMGCPLTDRDGDGIIDDKDKCPDQPEDKDGFQDSDGCPDLDNDNDGLLDTSDKCPNEAGPIENYGCPIVDRDKDGILDKDDKCPDEPEDKDGFQDEDGCPDPDNDGDGILDKDDKCPNEAGVAEEKGCPRQYKLVVVTKDKIEIKKQIKFATSSATIVGAESKAILADVAAALRDNPQIKKVRIEGHTDSVGNDDANMKLSQKRADSVRTALVKLKIDPARLEAVGFGETKPIASNATSAGRQENRRTEFNIVEQ